MRKQQGAALVISLLILIIITIVGVSAMQSTVVEEKMAINANERNRAFQAAETALRHAEENFIMGLLNTSNFTTGANGLYGQNNNEPNPFSTTWTNSNSQVYPNSIADVNTQPRFMVRIMDTIAGSDVSNMLNIRGYRRQNIASAITTVFRVTARGTGSTDQSQVIVRSHYGRTGL